MAESQGCGLNNLKVQTLELGLRLGLWMAESQGCGLNNLKVQTLELGLRLGLWIAESQGYMAQNHPKGGGCDKG